MCLGYAGVFSWLFLRWQGSGVADVLCVLWSQGESLLRWEGGGVLSTPRSLHVSIGFG